MKIKYFGAKYCFLLEKKKRVRIKLCLHQIMCCYKTKIYVLEVKVLGKQSNNSLNQLLNINTNDCVLKFKVPNHHL
ncbi:hypothetical protein Scep_004295 [Stephania cephalantha]|uniref:Uncharacterized protein n=1 Tax=Stephania cephalantha TaxID=152367 RepID=A0AAP0PYZ1_9MAGN